MTVPIIQISIVLALACAGIIDGGKLSISPFHRVASRVIGCVGLFGAYSSLPATITSNLITVTPAYAIEQQYKLPPIDYSDKTRCELRNSAIGQANAARDKLFDVRECDLKGQSGAGKDLSGIIGESSDFTGISFKEGQMSKGLLRRSNFQKCDFTNAIIDRATFEGSNLEGAVFANAVLSGTAFTDANLKDTDFTDAYLGPFDLKNLCANPTLGGTNPVTFMWQYFYVNYLVVMFS